MMLRGKIESDERQRYKDLEENPHREKYRNRQKILIER